jgi:hypothetical protein
MSDNQRADPEASRPVMPPEYGILGSSEGRGLLPWTWAVERLTQSRGYWLATTRPAGRPHMAVVWGIWLRDHFYFFTGATSRKARNLAANPSCVVCPEQTDEAVIVEGVAEVVTDPPLLRTFAEAYAAKYQEEVETAKFVTYGVRPVIAFGAISLARQRDPLAIPRCLSRSSPTTNANSHHRCCCEWSSTSQRLNEGMRETLTRCGLPEHHISDNGEWFEVRDRFAATLQQVLDAMGSQDGG